LAWIGKVQVLPKLDTLLGDDTLAFISILKAEACTPKLFSGNIRYWLRNVELRSRRYERHAYMSKQSLIFKSGARIHPFMQAQAALERLEVLSTNQ